jgi:hypothetical protein
MKHVTSYNLFESESEPIRKVFTREQLSWLDKCTENSWKYNPSTGLVDVDGDFYCSGQNLQDFKGVRFGTVGRGFSCKNNQLTTLEGAPQSVGGDFNCYNNQLTTLEGAPQSVGNSFNCDDNQLTTLVGAPQSVGGGFSCKNNQLTSLVGAPQSVGEDFDCENNQLTSLEGAPQAVNGRFSCRDNELTTLVGAPQKVNGAFSCVGNQLTSLVGAPQTVGEIFYCGGNPVSESTLKVIFALIRKGIAYQQALEQYWPEMEDEDRALMYKEMPNLPPEETRKYNALATYANIKDYL